MDSTLEKIIRETYPSGMLDDLNYPPNHFSKERDDRIIDAIENIEDGGNLAVHIAPSVFDYHEFCVTDKSLPPYRIWSNEDEEKAVASWIHTNSRCYPFFQVKISRFADYLMILYRHLVFSADNQIQRLPGDDLDDYWQKYIESIKGAFERHGFQQISEKAVDKEIPFLQQKDLSGIDENEPRWFDDDFIPALMPCTVYDVLFHE